LDADGEFKERLAALFAPFGELSKAQLEALERHYHLLLTWNEKLNLTRITAVEDATKLHYGESLFLGTVLPRGRLSIADVGSGAGFPGFPIAILRPECTVDLIEPHQRKAVFLREASRGIGNIRVLADRAETVTNRYDWLVSRAVRTEDVLSQKLACHVAILGVQGELEIPFVPGHRIKLFHVEHDKI